MEFKLNKRLYIGVGIALIISGLLLVIIPLIALSINPTNEMLDLALKLSVVGGILFIPGLIGLEKFINQCLVFFIGVGLVVGGVLVGISLLRLSYIPELAILAILLLLGGIPSILNSLFIYGWLEKKLELSDEETITSQQIYHTFMVYAILLAFAIGCGLLVALWFLWG
ncbi:MAG: hypothetical protein ACFFCS_25810 [Candidatus Hodarchaeota archaeon]